MIPTSFVEWLTWFGVVAPLFVIAISTARFVWIEVDKNKQRRYQRFFDLMEQIGRAGFSVAAKMAAVHELRKFPEYKDVILRLCVEDNKVEGPLGSLLEREFRLTAQHFGNNPDDRNHQARK